MLLLFFYAILLPAGEPAKGSLPASWHGAWVGTLQVRGGKADQDLPMRLEIQPLKDTDGHTWRILYGEGDKREVRAYELLPVADKPGHFVIDEKNGILLDARRIGDTLFNQFKVNDLLLAARYEQRGDSLLFEIATYRFSKPRATSPKGAMIEVHSYEPVGFQSATLKKASK